MTSIVLLKAYSVIKTHRAGICGALALLLSASPLWAQSGQDDTAGQVDTYNLLALFGDVLERVRADYVEKPDEKLLIENAINGMLSSLDPHSAYMNADNFNNMQVHTRGEFGGLGIEVTMENGLVKVVSPIDDTPAFKAGIQTGDLISAIDGVPVMGLNLGAAVEMMRGPHGSEVVLTILRGTDDPFEVSIVRDVIKIRSVRGKVEGDIGYLRITTFNANAMVGLERTIEKLLEENGDTLRGFVLDVRNNPGGLLDQAIKVSDAFMEQGEIVSTRSRRENEVQRYSATKGDLIGGLPMVVLVNGGSASASEIVAGALQDHRRAIIMGTRTFGKGSVQNIIPMGQQGALRLTTARYYTPSGASIQARGIAPDILVEQATLSPVQGNSTNRQYDESSLRGALKNEQENGTEDNPNDGNVGSPIDSEDYQLMRAIDFLRGLSLYRAPMSG